MFLWIIVSVILFSNFKKTLVASFDEQLKARAYIVAQKTNTQPKIVPLPQSGESFTILYSVNSLIDTLFSPPIVPFIYPSGKDSIISGKGWRAVRIQQPVENGGHIEVIFALASDSIDHRIKQLTLLIWIVLPAGCVLAAFLAYWLASKLLMPVRQVINQANALNINNNVKLLPEPESNNELKELIVSFNRMLLRIREQSVRQTAFFASASHELRTPLSTMQTRLQVLMRQEDRDDQVKDAYSEQLVEVQQLIKMVNDFLLFSELNSGDITIIKTSFNLSDIITDVISTYKVKSFEKQLYFKISYDPLEANYDVETDENKLQIILSNLFDNSIKYSSSASGINVLIQKINSEYIIAITNKIRSDIKPQLENIKNEFYHSKPLHGEGFGLGLWIANQLAEMLDFELKFIVEQKEFFKASIIIK